MPVTITIDVHDRGVGQALKVLAEVVEHPVAALREIGEYETTRTRARFDTSTDPDGIKWPDYKNSSYRVRKVARGYSPKLLIYTGAMKQSIHPEVDEEDNSVSISASAVSASGFPYPAVHQFGSETVPQRRFLGLGVEDQAHIMSIVLERLKRAIER